MCPADLLLLDEPTNHLDIDSLIWLENWLRHVEATVIIISHDREFLDRAVTTIWSVEDDTIRRYAGNFTKFEAERMERLRQQDAAHRAYEAKAASLRSFIDRFRAKATKARQAQSRIKMLEKLESVEAVRAKREWRFEFPKPVRLPEHLADAEGLACGYDDLVILRGVTFSVRSGERIGVLGVNGAGKSTLIKTVVGEIPKLAGELRRGQGLEIGYFAQHQLDQLRADESPLEHMKRLAPDVREQELRDHLGVYRFSGDFASAPVGPMSGGEKARLALALIAWTKPNLLVLDEPTNDLDIDSLELLEQTLQSYPGTIILVSHDRRFLDNVVTEVLAPEGEGRWREYVGGYADWLRQRTEPQPEAKAAPKEAKPQPVRRRTEKVRLSYKETKELEALPAKLEALEAEQAALIEKMSAPDYHQQSAETLRADAERMKAIEAETAEAFERWEALEAKKAEAEANA